MYIPDSYMERSKQSWEKNYVGKSFDQLYVMYQMEQMGKQLQQDIARQQAEMQQQVTGFIEDITGVTALRMIADPSEYSAEDIIMTLATLTLLGVKGTTGKALPTQKNEQPIYTNGKIFISPDLDSHIGGTLKAAKQLKI